MTQTFAAQAQRLFALGAQRLGWTPDIFWRATPHELAAALAAPPNREEPELGIARDQLQDMMERDRNG